MTTRVLTNATDTTTRSVEPGTNYLASSWMETGSGQAYGWIHFPRPFERGATIIRAVLRLRTLETSAASRTITVQRFDRLVNFSRVTWASPQPGYLAPGASTTITSGSAQTVEIDVTAQMQAVSDGAPWWGWRLSSSSPSPIRFHSAQSRYDWARPTLEIEWADAPDEPSDLTPSSGLAVSLAKPVLRWTYSDFGGNTEQSHVHVRISSDPAMSAGLWDSGVLPLTDPELDLASTSFPGLTGSRSYWQVRVRDGAGLWSGWSSVASTRYVARPVATITEPAGSTIMDPTPTVRWSFAGTQEQFRVFVRQVGKRDPSWDSGRRVGAEQLLTVPAGFLRDDVQYEVTVQVWDNVDRVSTPGAADYWQATRVVVFDEDLATPPVDGVSATARGRTPFVDVEWTAASTPDFFTIGRDGRLLAKVTPAEVQIAPGVYAWTDRTCPPQVEQPYTVRSMVAGKRSRPVTTWTLTRPAGVWLLTADTEVCMTGKDLGSPTLGSRETVHEAGARVVVIEDALRGHEGQWAGQLKTDIEIACGVTAKEWRDRFMQIRRNRDGARLVMGPINVPVVLSEMVARSGAEEALHYDVSFSYHQAPGPELDAIDTVG